MKKFKLKVFIYVITIGVTTAYFSYNLFALGTDLDGRTAIFIDALDEFGANSIEQAANLWAKGVKNRNGALQYAVMSSELKEIFYKILEKEYSSWITGGSSPWVESYEIFNKQIRNEQTQITLNFNLETSIGSKGSYKVDLFIEKEGNYYVIKDIKMDPLLQEYLNYPEL